MKMLFALFCVVGLSARGGESGRLVFHFDFKAGEMRREELSRLLRDAKAWGYTSILWELEDMVRFDALGPAVRPTAYSKEEFRSILKEAAELGLEPIPHMQVFGHSEFLMRHEAFRWMREKESDPSCCCVSEPKVQAFLQALFDECLDLFGPSVRTFHLAGDEAHSFGTCPVCSKRPRGELYVEHLERFAAKLRKRSTRPGIWSDMLLSELDDRAVSNLGKDYVIWQWDYDFGTGRAKPWTAKLDRILGKGFDIVICGAAQSVGDDPFLVRYGYHRQNLAASAQFVRDRHLAGFCVTSWSVRGAGKWAQRPLFDFAARRYRNGEARTQAEDWADCVETSFGGIPPELLGRLSDCSQEIRRIDGRNRRRHYDPTHKPAAPADNPDFAEEVADRLADTKVAAQELQRCAASLTPLGARLLPATECKLVFLAFAADFFAGKHPKVDLAPFVRFYALEETPASAEISATIPFSRMGY